MLIKIKDKIIGRIEGKTFYTTRKPEHFMRKYMGFGLSVSVVEGLDAQGVETVKIKYLGASEILYSCPLSKFMTSDKTWNFLGEDEQVFVSTKDMEKGFSTDKQKKLWT